MLPNVTKGSPVVGIHCWGNIWDAGTGMFLQHFSNNTKKKNFKPIESVGWTVLLTVEMQKKGLFLFKSCWGRKEPKVSESQCNTYPCLPPPHFFHRYPPGVVGVAPGGIPGALEGMVPGGVPIAHTLPSGTHPSQAPSPNQPSKHGETREHLTEQ